MDESKTDEEHILYMLDGSDRGRIEALHEAQESWGFGGGIDIHKERPIVRMGDEFFALRRRTEFYVEGFDVSLGRAGLLRRDRRVRGHAVWFRRGSDPLRPQRRADRSLCGWVEPERGEDVTAWVNTLNQLIQDNLDRAGAPSAEDERQAALQRHTQGTAALLRSIGVPLPSVDTMDDLVGEVRRLGQDSPIAGRDHTKPKE